MKSRRLMSLSREVPDRAKCSSTATLLKQSKICSKRWKVCLETLGRFSKMHNAEDAKRASGVAEGS
jgi:hypothetical protein